jgi:hypothetical protein
MKSDLESESLRESEVQNGSDVVRIEKSRVKESEELQLGWFSTQKVLDQLRPPIEGNSC